MNKNFIKNTCLRLCLLCLLICMTACASTTTTNNTTTITLSSFKTNSENIQKPARDMSFLSSVLLPTPAYINKNDIIHEQPAKLLKLSAIHSNYTFVINSKNAKKQLQVEKNLLELQQDTEVLDNSVIELLAEYTEKQRAAISEDICITGSLEFHSLDDCDENFNSENFQQIGEKSLNLETFSKEEQETEDSISRNINSAENTWFTTLEGYYNKEQNPEHIIRISSRFGPRGRRFHHGLDISAPKGTEILAYQQGKVIYAARMSSFGLFVVIEHADGSFSRYAHMSEILAKVGDIVSAGTVIGKVGSTGRSTGNHLHLEIIQNNERIDPELIIKSTEMVVRYNDGSKKKEENVANSSNKRDMKKDTKIDKDI